MSNQIETQIDVSLTERNRLTAFFRLIRIAPVAIFILSFAPQQFDSDSMSWVAGFFVLPVVLSIVFRQAYPSYLLAFNDAFLSLSTRIDAYLLVLTDEYPSIEANPNIKVDLPDIEGGAKLSRVLPLVKWIFAIPLFIVGIIYAVIALVLTFFAWIITSSTGNYPESIANFVLGTIEFWNRLYGYAFILVTDDYPSFTL